jgi:hypothetical protein
LWMLLSLLIHVTWVPASTESAAGWKFRDMLDPMPEGMMMSAVIPVAVLVLAAVLELLELELLDELLGLEVVEVVELVVVVVVDEAGTKMK